MIVVDASTIISWVLDDENSGAANAVMEHLVREGAIAPGNFWTEVVHALARAERRGRTDPTGADLMLAEIETLPIEIHSPEPRALLALSRSYQLTGYDASYLGLALQSHLPLATVDATLSAAAKAAKCAWKAK
jgi:predicted nucleic acid-binding protein